MKLRTAIELARNILVTSTQYFFQQKPSSPPLERLQGKNAFSTYTRNVMIPYNFYFDNLSPDKIKSAAHTIASDQNKHILTITNTDFNISTIKYLGWALEKNAHLNYVFLKNNDIDDTFAATLASYFKRSNSINSIDLSGNIIGEKGSIALQEMIQGHPCIKEIILDDNPCAEKDLHDNKSSFLRLVNESAVKKIKHKEELFLSSEPSTWCDKIKVQETKVIVPGKEITRF